MIRPGGIDRSADLTIGWADPGAGEARRDAERDDDDDVSFGQMLGGAMAVAASGARPTEAGRSDGGGHAAGSTGAQDMAVRRAREAGANDARGMSGASGASGRARTERTAAGGVADRAGRDSAARNEAARLGDGRDAATAAAARQAGRDSAA
ncbi:MAG TPA: hypothetical protein VK698_34220, partial [Kofleriaceae bacterium]|nr:hypothetical protein [Kofleriaceae bacterium]